MKKKTILFVEFLPIGGSSTGLLTELKFLHNHYPDQFESIVISRPNSIFRPEAKNLNFRLHEHEAVELASFRYNPLKTLKTYFSTLFFVFKIAIKHNPDVIHCYHYMWSIYANPVGFFLNKPVIIHLKDVWLLRPKIARILMKFNPRTRYIAVSKYVKDLFIKKYKVNRLGQKVVMIYDGVDGKIFSRATKGEILKKQKRGEKLFVMMSRVVPERNIEVFIDFAALLLKKYSKFRFAHFGYSQSYVDQNYFATLEARVKLLGISDSFGFNDYVDDPKKLAKIYQSAYLSIVPARQFALPNVAIESMMCTTPVVALRIGGNPEIIKDDRMGTLVEVNSSLLYAQAVEAFLSEKKNYLEVAIGASEFAHKTFSAEQLFKKIVKLYQK